MEIISSKDIDLTRKVDRYLSIISRNYYKNQNLNGKDRHNIGAMFNKLHEVLPLLAQRSILDISNLAEVASFMKYNNNSFWDDIETIIASKKYKMNLKTIS
jgi:hypothetical protein